MSVNETSVRSILVHLDSIKPEFWSAFHLDAYEVPRKFFLEPQSFSKPLKIKTNAVKLLNKKLSNCSQHLRDIITIGSKGEPFGEAERHYKLTRGLLETLLLYRYPVHLISSSENILEDIELLRQIAEVSFLHISVPIVCKHPLYDRFYPENNFEEALFLIKSLRLALPDVHVSAIILPMIPTIGDDSHTIEPMLQALKRVGTKSISVTLIDEINVKQLQILLDTLQDFPELIETFEKRFDLEIEDGILIEGAVKVLEKERDKFISTVESLLERYQLSFFVPRYIPKDFRHSNYILAQRLFYRAHHYERLGEESQTVREIADKIQNLLHTVTKKELLEFTKNEKVKRDIDYFLFNNELKTFGQARLF